MATQGASPEEREACLTELYLFCHANAGTMGRAHNLWAYFADRWGGCIRPVE